MKNMACVLPHFAVRWGALFAEIVPAVNRWRVKRWEAATKISWTAERAKEAARAAKELDAMEAMRAAGGDSSSESEYEDEEDFGSPDGTGSFLSSVPGTVPGEGLGLQGGSGAPESEESRLVHRVSSGARRRKKKTDYS